MKIWIKKLLVLMAAFMLCMLLSMAAASAADVEFKLVPASSMMFDDRGGIIKYTPAYTDGDYKLTINTEDTNWPLFMLAENIVSSTNWAVPLEIKLPEEAAGYIVLADNSLDFEDNDAILSWMQEHSFNIHMREDWENPGEMNFPPYWELLTYDKSNHFFSAYLHPQWEYDYALFVALVNENQEIYEVQKMKINIGFDNEGWFVEAPGTVTSPAYLSSGTDGIEIYNDQYSGYEVLVTPSVLENAQEATVVMEYITPEGAASYYKYGEIQQLQEWDTSIYSYIDLYDWSSDSIRDRTITDTIVWFDAQGNMMPESGMVQIKINSTEMDADVRWDNTWMHNAMESDNLWGPLEPSRLAADTKSDLPFGEDDGVIYWDLSTGGVDFMLNADNLTVDELENLAFTGYTIALGAEATWAGADKYTVVAENFDYLYGPNPSKAQQIIERMYEKYEFNDDVYEATDVGFQNELYGHQYFKRLTSGYHGTDIFTANLSAQSDEGGRVLFFGWFDDAGELIRIDWLRVTGRSDALTAAADVVASVDAITAPVDNPVLVSSNANGMTITFKAQESIEEEDGYKGYLVELELTNEPDGTEKIVLPYALGAEKDHEFRLLSYNGLKAETITNFAVEDNGVVFTPTQKKSTYVLNWKEPKELTVEPIYMDDVIIDDFSGTLEYTSSSTDGAFDITIDDEATDWATLLLHAGNPQELGLHLRVKVPAGMKAAYVVTGNAFTSDQDIIDSLQARLQEGVFGAIHNSAVDVNWKFATYDQDAKQIEPYIRQQWQHPYRIAIGLLDNENDTRLDAVLTMTMNVEHTLDEGWTVNALPDYDGEVQLMDADLNGIEWAESKGGAACFFDPFGRDDWQDKSLTLRFTAPEGAQYLQMGTEEMSDFDPADGYYDWTIAPFWDGATEQISSGRTVAIPMMWMDADRRVLVGSGVFDLRFVNTNNIDGGTWMHYAKAMDDRWGGLTFDRLAADTDSDLPFGFDEGVLYWSSNPDGVDFVLDADRMTIGEVENLANTGYSIALGHKGAWNGASGYAVVVDDAEKLSGYQPEKEQQIISQLEKAYKEEPIPAAQVGYQYKLYESPYFEQLDTDYAGVEVFASTLHEYYEDTGKVCYFGWFDEAGELIRIDWLRVTGRSNDMTAAADVVASVDAITAAVDNPVLAAANGNGMTITFKAQKSVQEADGYKGYLVDLDLTNAPDGTEKIVLPYALGADADTHEFRLVSYTDDGVKVINDFVLENGGVVFTPTQQNSTYVLSWKTPGKLTLTPFTADKIAINDFGGALVYTNNSTDGHLNITIDADKTDWDKMVLANSGNERVDMEFLFDLPVDITNANFSNGYTWETDAQILEVMQKFMDENGLNAISNHELSGFVPIGSYDDQKGALTLEPVVTAQQRKYRINAACANNPNDTKLDAVYYMNVDISFTGDITNIKVAPPRYDLDVVVTAGDVPIEWTRNETGGVITFDSSMDFDWENEYVYFNFQAPQGARYVYCEGWEHGVATDQWSCGFPLFTWGNFEGLPTKNATKHFSLQWRDENHDPLPHSGLFTVRILDSNEAADKTWMELEESDIWSAMPASRLKVQVDHSAKGTPFSYEKKDGFVHHFLNPNYTYTQENVQGLLEDDMYCIANYRVTAPANAAKLATDVWMYDEGLLGYNGEMLPQVMEELLKRPRTAVTAGKETKDLGVDNFLQVQEISDYGIKMTTTQFKNRDNHGGNVFFYAWFDKNDELIKVEWFCETGEMIQFKKNATVYQRNGEVPVNVTEPVLVDHRNAGVGLSVGFVPQAPIVGKDGYKGYTVALTVVDAGGETVESPEDLSVFLPYPKSVANIGDARFKVIRLARGVKEDVSFHMGMSGVEIDMRANGEYVLMWKEGEMVRLPANLKEIKPYAFENSAFTAVRCPDGMETIGEYAFKGSEKLERIYIGCDTQIDPHAFDGCTSLSVIQSEMMGCPAQDLADMLGIEFQINMK